MAESWKDTWRRRNPWSKRELALLCCGMNPKRADARDSRVLRDPRYLQAVKRIDMAVNAGVLQKADGLRPTDADVFTDQTPLFKPVDVVEWASEQFPKFPFSPAEFRTHSTSAPEADGPLETKERHTLQKLIAVLAQMGAAELPLPLDQLTTASVMVEAAAKRLKYRLAPTTTEKHLKAALMYFNACVKAAEKERQERNTASSLAQIVTK